MLQEHFISHTGFVPRQPPHLRLEFAKHSTGAGHYLDPCRRATILERADDKLRRVE